MTFKLDPFFLSLGVAGLVFGAIRRDALLLLWIIPFLIFLYFAGFVSYWHLVPLFPLFCIASARLIENLSKMIKRNKLQQILPLIAICVICIFGLATITKLMITSSNSFHYQAAAFISQYLRDNTNNNNNKITLISNPFYSWIPKYGFHLDNYQIVDYYDNIPLKAKRVVLMADTPWFIRLFLHRVNNNMEENVFHMVQINSQCLDIDISVSLYMNHKMIKIYHCLLHLDQQIRMHFLNIII